MGAIYPGLSVDRKGRMDVVDKLRMPAAALVAIMIAAITTVAIYILLVVASFFVMMPSVAQSIIWVGGVLALVFTGTFVVAFRKMLAAFTS